MSTGPETVVRFFRHRSFDRVSQWAELSDGSILEGPTLSRCGCFEGDNDWKACAFLNADELRAAMKVEVWDERLKDESLRKWDRDNRNNPLTLAIWGPTLQRL